MRIGTAAQGLALGLLLISAPEFSSAQIGIGVSIRIGPPALPVYVQPPCPVDGYLWTPGYWAYGPDGYYWVPGVWVAPPRVGLLWTPGYWGYEGGFYGWHAGYWGPHIGFYGGVNYGFGYIGTGFVGGVWAGNVFRYNRAVVNVNTTVVRNVYVDRTVVHNTVINRTSFNGPGGIGARPSPQEQAWSRESHVQPVAAQISHEQAAGHDRAQLASVNGGRPAAAAMDRPGGQRFGAQGRAPGAPAGVARANTPQPHPNAQPRPYSAQPHANMARPNPEGGARERPQPAVNRPAPAPRAEAPHNNRPPAQSPQPHPEHGGHKP